MNNQSSNINSINLEEKYSKLDEPWLAGIVAQFNDYHIKVVKIHGEYIWHQHENTDELFIVIEGQLTIELRGSTVIVKAGEMYVVPKGVEHKPSAIAECKVILIEPSSITSAGSSVQEYAEENDVWI